MLLVSTYQMISASKDWPRYIDIFNKNIVYAPYTIPLSMELIENHILETYDEKNQLCLIGKNNDGEGIIHVGIYKPDYKKEMGLIYILLGDNNNIAEYLLREAEEWFKEKKQSLVRACNYRPNPYKYILHGSETYVWGGDIPTINAYRRLNYDLVDESIVMIYNILFEPQISIPDIPNLKFTKENLTENSLVFVGIIRSFIDDKQVGYCKYEYLKAISQYYKKAIGQIAIDIDNNLYGKGLGRELLIRSHKALYDLGAKQVMLHTVQRLFRAKKLYEKVGYIEQNIRGFCFSKEFQKDF